MLIPKNTKQYNRTGCSHTRRQELRLQIYAKRKEPGTGKDKAFGSTPVQFLNRQNSSSEIEVRTWWSLGGATDDRDAGTLWAGGNVLNPFSLMVTWHRQLLKLSKLNI